MPVLWVLTAMQFPNKCTEGAACIHAAMPCQAGSCRRQSSAAVL